MRTLNRVGTGLLALTLIGGVAACSDDADSADTATTTTAAEDAGGETVEVTAVDYAFEGLPESVSAGTTLLSRPSGRVQKGGTTVTDTRNPR